MSIINQFELKGKTALVTGSDTGLGQAMAIALAEAGADIIGTSRSNAANAADTQSRIEALGRKYTGYVIDISERE